MSHFAKVIDGIVTEVIVATQAEINSERHGDAFLWVQTSYNNNFRNKFTAIGNTYDPIRDEFITTQPYASWSLSSDNVWEAPISYPTDGSAYYWNEEISSWGLAIPAN